MLELLLSGMFLGIAAGFSPGPLLVLAVSETVKGNFRNGVFVALAPLITDLPIVALALLLISRISDNNLLLGMIYILGGLFLFWLAFGDIRFNSTASGDAKPSNSLKKGIIANFLNPQPYLWWISIGAPVVLDAWIIGYRFALAFVLAFYCCLVGSKVAVAIITHFSRGFMKSKGYLWTLRILGLILIVFAILFIRDGLSLMQII